MRVETMGAGNKVAATDNVRQVVILADDGTVLCVAWQCAAKGTLIAHAGDSDFNDVLRLLGLPNVEIATMEVSR